MQICILSEPLSAPELSPQTESAPREDLVNADVELAEDIHKGKVSHPETKRMFYNSF